MGDASSFWIGKAVEQTCMNRVFQNPIRVSSLPPLWKSCHSLIDIDDKQYSLPTSGTYLEPSHLVLQFPDTSQAETMRQINLYGSRSTCPLAVIILCWPLPSGAAFSDDAAVSAKRIDSVKQGVFFLVSYQVTRGFSIQQTFPGHLLSLFCLVSGDAISASHYHPLDNCGRARSLGFSLNRLHFGSRFVFIPKAMSDFHPSLFLD